MILNAIFKKITTAAVLCFIVDSGAWAQNSGKQKYDWEHQPTAQLPVFKADTFTIVKYGAKANGGFVNTLSITAAIEACSSHGGGVVLIPPGNWLTGPIRLKSNVELHLEKGSRMEFSSDKSLYPLVSGNFEGLQSVRNQSPLSADDAENIAITGQGIIDGNGDVWRPLSREKRSSEEWDAKVNSGGVLSEDGKTWFPSAQSKLGQQMAKSGQLEKLSTIADFEPIKDYLRPNLLVFTRCKNILLQGVTFQNSPGWCLHLLMCNELTIDRAKVNNPAWAQNGDGCDIESCRNVVIANSSFECGDDGICIKSGKDEQGRKRGMPTENVTIHDDTVYHAHGGFVIGSEMSGGAKNIYVSHCTFSGTDKGLRFKTTRGRGGVVSNIYVKDIFMKDIIQEAIYFDMYYFAASPKAGEVINTYPVDQTTPQFKNFYISDIRCEGSQKGIFVRGLPEMKIENINFINIDLKSKIGVEIIEANQIHLSNIKLTTAQSNPLVFIENSSNIDFNALNVDSKTKLMFDIAGDKSKNISASSISGKEISTLAQFSDHADKSVFTVK